MNTNAEQKTYHITAIESSKGGVGKTTSTAMIAQILALSGQRVLIVDMDFQRNCTDMMAKNIEQVPEVSMRDLVLKDLTLEEVEKTIIPSKLENLDIVPTCEDIESLHYDLYDEVNHNENANAIMCFRNNLLQIAGTKYDHIVIDCSPAITTLSSALGIACDTILCPIEADNFGYQSVVKIVNMAAEIETYYELHEKKKAYVFMTKVKSRTNRAKDMFAGYAEMLNDMFLPTPIRMSEVLAKSSTDFVPLMLSPNKRNECVNDYMDLLKAIDYLDGHQFIKVRKYQNGTNSKKKTNKKSTKKGAK